MKAVYLKDKTGNKVVTVPYYRIGDLFLTTMATNPSSYLGGKWELFGPGRCLVCVDTSQAEFNSVKKTGGSKELQSHHHGITTWNYYSNKPQGGTKISHTFDSADGGLTTAITSNTGSGNSGNLQPFITCYVWIRIA